MTEPNLIEARGLVAGYHRRPVVGPLDLTLAPTDTLALVGPNGVGKSTILKTIAGLLPPLAGTITYQGGPNAGAPVYLNARRGLVLVGEHRANVLRSLPVQDNLALATRHKVNPEDEFDPYDIFPKLRERRRQIAATLSGGELQMLSLAMALALSPRCLLLDEPSAGLAPVIVGVVREVLEAMRTNRLCMIVAEQRPDVFRGLCDHIMVVAGGTLAPVGPETDLSGQALIATYFADRRTRP